MRMSCLDVFVVGLLIFIFADGSLCFALMVIAALR